MPPAVKSAIHSAFIGGNRETRKIEGRPRRPKASRFVTIPSARLHIRTNVHSPPTPPEPINSGIFPHLCAFAKQTSKVSARRAHFFLLRLCVKLRASNRKWRSLPSCQSCTSCPKIPLFASLCPATAGSPREFPVWLRLRRAMYSAFESPSDPSQLFCNLWKSAEICG